MSKIKKISQIKKNASIWPIKNYRNSKMTKMHEVMERPKRRRRKGQISVRFAFGRWSSHFLCSCLFLVSMFAVGLCVLWVLCGPSKATVRCYTSICDGIILVDLAVANLLPVFNSCCTVSIFGHRAPLQHKESWQNQT